MTPEERAIELWNAIRNEDRPELVRQLLSIGLRTAIAAEREGCALAAEKEATWVHYDPYEVQVDMRARIAAAIRARSQ